jgi:hypothetical protein
MADILEKQRVDRGVKAQFGFYLTAVDGPNRQATFKVRPSKLQLARLASEGLQVSFKGHF